MRLVIVSLPLLSVLFVGAPQTNHAQEWTLEVVEGGLDYPWVHAGDFDNDDTPDLVSMDGDSLIWYENLLPGWTRHTIDPSFPRGDDYTIDVFDLDRDGDMDFTIAGFADPGLLAWYENMMDGMEWQRHLIDSTLSYPSTRRFSCSDLDDDVDIDIVCPGYGDGRIFWFENMSGDTAWTRHVVATLNGATWCTVGNVMGDSKPDIIAAAWYGNAVNCYENQLPDTTWPVTTISHLSGTALGECADIDGDSDLDLVTHSNEAGRVYWCVNPTWETHIVGFLSRAWLGNVGDLDGDGDLDITFGQDALAASSEIGWFENSGDGTSWEEWVIATAPTGLTLTPTALADLNSDSFPDIVATQMDNRRFGDVRWYENPAPPLGIEDESSPAKRIPGQFKLYQNSPNPFNPATTITFDVPGTSKSKQRVQLTVYNIRGKHVIRIVDGDYEPGSHRVVWNGKDEQGRQVSSGIYLYTLRSGEKISTRKMVLLK